MRQSFVKRVLDTYKETINSMSPRLFYSHLLRTGMGKDEAHEHLMASLIPGLSETNRDLMFGNKYEGIEKSYNDIAVIYSKQLHRAQLRGLMNKIPNKNTYIVLGGYNTDFYNYDAYMDFRTCLSAGYEENKEKVEKYIYKWLDKGMIKPEDLSDIDRLRYKQDGTRSHLDTILRERKPASLVIRSKNGKNTIINKPEDFGIIMNNHLYKTTYLPHISIPRAHPVKHHEYISEGIPTFRCVMSQHCMDCKLQDKMSCTKHLVDQAPVLYLKRQPTIYEAKTFYENNPHATLSLLERNVMASGKISWAETDTFLTVEDLVRPEGMPHGLGFEAVIMDMEMNGLNVNPGMTTFSDDKKLDAAHDALLVGNSDMLESMILESHTPDPMDMEYIRDIIREVVEDHIKWNKLDTDYLTIIKEDKVLEAFLKDERIIELVNTYKY